MKVYKVTANVTYQATVTVEAEGLADAENLGKSLIEDGRAELELLEIDEDVIGEVLDDQKPANVCIACEG